MSDMSIQEIEALAAHEDNRECAAYESGCDCAWCIGRKVASALRQLMNEQKWRDIAEFPDDLKDGRTLLIGGGLQRGLTWVEPVFWHDGTECHPSRGSAGFFAESDRGNLLTARNVTGEVFMPLPLPSPPETSDE